MKVVYLNFFLICIPLLGEGLLIIKSGKLYGILSSKGEAWIEVIEDEGLIHRYLAPWKGGSPARGGGFNLKVLGEFEELVVGNRVYLDWFWDGHLRVKQVKQIKPLKKSGIFKGTLIKKGDKWIDVENESSLIPWRFYARWKGGLPEDGGEYHPETLRFFDNFKVEDAVRFAWSYDFRPRIDRFIEQEKDDVFIPFYELQPIPDSTSVPSSIPPHTVNPFDQVPKSNPFDQIPAEVNPFDQISSPINPFDQTDSTQSPDYQSENPFDQAIDAKQDGDGSYETLSIPKPEVGNPFENIPLPGNPFDTIPKD